MSTDVRMRGFQQRTATGLGHWASTSASLVLFEWVERYPLRQRVIAKIEDLGGRFSGVFDGMQILPGGERHGSAEYDQDGQWVTLYSTANLSDKELRILAAILELMNVDFIGTRLRKSWSELRPIQFVYGILLKDDG